MAVVNRPDYSVGVWASNGDIAAPTSEKIEIGHIVEKPLKEVMNWIQNRQDKGIVYLMQQGISEWVSTETYPENGYVKRSGVIYKALSQNTDRDPLTYTDIWRQAFDTFGSAAEVQLEVDKIKTQEGYLDLYVSKNNPILNARAEGVSYVAAEGVPTLTSDEYGFTFKNHLLSGLFLAGDDPIIMRNGVEIARFDTPTNPNEDSKKVVTMDVLREFIQTYKVGDLYITTQNENPSTRLGYGTWERYGEGRALVGFSSSTSNSIPEWVKVVNSTFGSYTHKLSVEEMPRHSHGIKEETGGSTGGSGSVDTSSQTVAPVNMTMIQETGGSAEHNNVQPSIVVFMWRRVS